MKAANNKYIEIKIEDVLNHIQQKNIDRYLMDLKSQSDRENKKIKLAVGGLATMPLNQAIDASTLISGQTQSDIVSRLIITGMTPDIRDIIDLGVRKKKS